MKRLLRAFLYSLLLAFISVVVVSLFWNKPFYLFIIICILSILMLTIWNNKEDFYLFIICGITGALAETIAIFFGAWTYSYSNFIGIPYWLFPLWGLAAVFIKKISLEIHDFITRKK